jgi:hypothetical protein
MNLAADADALRKAVTFYASFDEAVAADLGGGRRTPGTRFDHETEQGQFVFEEGIDDQVFRIARDQGISGGALEVTDVLPRRGRLFFPAQGNIAFRNGGWGGSASMWIRTDPDTMLKLPYCDPIQITHKGAGNGGIWFDFNDAKPRDLRMGVFPAVPAGETGIPESDPQAPLIRVPRIGFRNDVWHHVVLTWTNFDTGRPDAHAALYIDCKLMGEVKDRALAMDWDLDQTGIYTAVGYCGLLDELALFDRALTPAEVALLREKPGVVKANRTAERRDHLQK